jgi:hypothetical protein
MDGPGRSALIFFFLFGLVQSGIMQFFIFGLATCNYKPAPTRWTELPCIWVNFAFEWVAFRQYLLYSSKTNTMSLNIVYRVILSEKGLSNCPNWTAVVSYGLSSESRATSHFLYILGIIRGRKSEPRPPKSKSDIWKGGDFVAINDPMSTPVPPGSNYFSQGLHV